MKQARGPLILAAYLAVPFGCGSREPAATPDCPAAVAAPVQAPAVPIEEVLRPLAKPTPEPPPVSGELAEGDSCQPHEGQTCAGESTCVASDGGLGVCAIEPSVRAVRDRPEAFTGRFLALTGDVLTPTQGLCTLVECHPSKPCCNTCWAAQGLYLDGETGRAAIPFAHPTGEKFRCSGTNCDYQQSCQLANGTYTVFGHWARDRFGEFALAVHYWFRHPKP